MKRILQIIAAAGLFGFSTMGHAVLIGSNNNFPTQFFDLDSNTATATLLSTATPNALAFGLDQRSDGTLYGSSSRLVTIDPFSGNTAEIGIAPDLISSISFSPDDRLFGINNGGDTLFELNPSTAAAISTVAITGPASGRLFGLEFGSDGTLYAVGFDLYRIEIATGVSIAITPAGTDIATTSADSTGLLTDLDFGEDGILRSISSDASAGTQQYLYEIDPLTGLGVEIGPTNVSMRGLATFVAAASPVPLPGSLLLMAIGVGAGSMRRRNTSTSTACLSTSGT